MKSEKREVSNFDRLALRGYGELNVRQGDEELLEIEADDQILPKIKTEVIGGKLKIDVIEDWIERIGAMFTQGFESQRIKYHLVVKNLTSLDISGATIVRIDGLQSPDLEITLGGAGEMQAIGLQIKRLDVNFPGTGSMRLAGQAGSQIVTMGGAGIYNASRLECPQVSVRLAGVGKATVWAQEKLDIVINGLGSVEYYGQPDVSQAVQGLGTVHKLISRSDEDTLVSGKAYGQHQE